MGARSRPDDSRATGERVAFTRRQALTAALGMTVAAASGGVVTRLRAGRTAAALLPTRLKGRLPLSKVLALKPRWASWTVDELNARPDGWSRPGAWVPTILNSRDQAAYYEAFPDESAASHHWGMVIDLRRCIGCQACVVACKSENNVPPGNYRTWVEVVELGTMVRDPSGSIVTEDGRFTPTVKRWALPRLCNHCDNPPCVIVCPVQATFKRGDGPVLVDYTKCIGCGICIQACPYDARYFHSVQETADKCTFCVQRLDRGLLPACVTSCVGRARVFGDLNDPQSAASQLLAQYPTITLLPEEGTDPQIFYINLNGELVSAATAFDTVYPYAVGTNTDQYAELSGQMVLQTPLGGE